MTYKCDLCQKTVHIIRTDDGKVWKCEHCYWKEQKDVVKYNYGRQQRKTC